MDFLSSTSAGKKGREDGQHNGSIIDLYFRKVQIAKVCYMVQHLGG